MRASRTLLALAAGALSSASVYAGPKPAPGKTPPVAAQTELELVRVERVDNKTLSAGMTLSLNVVIANRGTTTATVAAGVATKDTSQGVLRSGSTVLPAGQEKKLRVDVPITQRAVRREQLSLQVVIADPRQPATGNALQQLYRDANLGNNSKSPAYPVRVDFYDVSVVWRKLIISNDCEPGNAIGNWKLSFELGNLNQGDAASGTGRYHTRGSFLPRPASSFHWPSAGGHRSVSTGQTIALHQQLIRMPNVHKQRHLSAHISAYRQTPPFSYQSYFVGWVMKTIPPATWNFGTTWRGSPVDVGTSGPGVKPHDQCGHSPYIVELQITTTPTLLI